MLTASAAAGAILPLLAADAPTAGPGWWDVISGLLLAVAGMWATWAQFVYPRLAERKAKRQAGAEPAPVAPPPAPSVDPLALMIRDQQQRVDDLIDELAGAHRKHARDAGTIARLTAQLAEARRHVAEARRYAADAVAAHAKALRQLDESRQHLRRVERVARNTPNTEPMEAIK